MQEQCQAEIDKEQAARVRSDEKMALRYNEEEVAGANAESLAMNRSKRSLTKTMHVMAVVAHTR